jgi:hypothetical protein
VESEEIFSSVPSKESELRRGQRGMASVVPAAEQRDKVEDSKDSRRPWSSDEDELILKLVTPSPIPQEQVRVRGFI